MLEKIALRLFGGLTRPYMDYFDGLRTNIKQGQMTYTIHEYVSVMFLTTIIAFIVIMLAGSFFIALTTGFQMYSVTLAVIVSSAGSAGTFFLVYYYPSIKAKGIQGKIKRDLPFAVIYMSTAAASEVNPSQIFKMVSARGGEVGRECQRVYRDINMLGMDSTTAITKAANRTPSPQFAELLWGMISILERGGNLGKYLVEKSREYMSEYRRSLKDYSNAISFYTEIYITLIIVGTLFFIVLSSIMSPLVGGDILLIQTFLVFFFIPLISVGFLVLLKGLYPATS